MEDLKNIAIGMIILGLLLLIAGLIVTVRSKRRDKDVPPRP
ncbi:MAG TPA: LPXTG cell wall anchor domain-containing protein [Allosphingosinicella sp.]